MVPNTEVPTTGGIFGNRVLRRERYDDGEKYTVRYFVICSLHHTQKDCDV
jgi:hypothetical protein